MFNPHVFRESAACFADEFSFLVAGVGDTKRLDAISHDQSIGPSVSENLWRFEVSQVLDLYILEPLFENLGREPLVFSCGCPGFLKRHSHAIHSRH